MPIIEIHKSTLNEHIKQELTHRSSPEDPCPPDLGGSGQEVEIFGKSPLPVPVSRGVPSRPLAGEPEAGFLVVGLLGFSTLNSTRQNYHGDLVLC